MFLCRLWLAKPLGRLRSNFQNFNHRSSGINVKLKKFTKKQQNKSALTLFRMGDCWYADLVRLTVELKELES